MISFDDFKKVEIKIGKVISAESVEGSDKLVRLMVDFGPSVNSGSNEPRQVISGIAKLYKPRDLVGKLFPFVTNLEPRKIIGLESQAMILAIGDEAVLLKPLKKVPVGSVIR